MGAHASKVIKIKMDNALRSQTLSQKVTYLVVLILETVISEVLLTTTLETACQTILAPPTLEATMDLAAPLPQLQPQQ